MAHTNSSGFSLIELLVVVAMVGMLLAVAIPGYRNMTLDNCLTSTANEFVSALYLARSEAVKGGLNATVAPVAAGADPTIAGNTLWGGAWNVTDGGGAVVQAVQLSAGCNANVTLSSPAAIVTYTPRGGVVAGAQIILNVCDSLRAGERGRIITVAPTGRSSVTNPPVANTPCA